MGKIIFKAILGKLTFDGISRTSHAGTLRTAALDHKATDDSVKDQAVIEAVFDKADKIVYSVRSFITSPFAIVMVTIGFAIFSVSFFIC